MSTNVGSIHYDLSLKTDNFDRASSNISSKLSSVGSRMQDTGKKMTMFLTLPVVAGMGFAVKAASDLQETINKVDVSFGKQANTVKQWAQTSITSMGLAKQSALDAAALFGDMATSMGLNQVEAAKMSMSLTQLGADLASFKNISFAEAQTALAGVFTGETESLKRLGIVMTETNLEAYALSRGIDKNIKNMTQAEKVQLRYAYVMDVTKNAQGDFARTSQSTANQIRMTKERFKELSAQIGEQLLPVANKLMEFASKLLDNFSKLSPGTQKMILIFAGIVAVLGPLVFILGTIVSMFAGLATIAAALGVGLGVLIAIIAGVIATVALWAGLAYLVIRNWDTLKQWFNTFLTFITSIFTAIWQKIVTTWQSVLNTTRAVLTAVWNVISPILNFIKNIFIIVFGGILLLIINYFRMYYNIVSSTMRAIWSVVSTVWNAVYNAISGVVRRILAFFAPAFNWLVGRGRDIIRGLTSGITSMAGSLVGGISRVSANIGRFFSGAGRWLWDTGVALIQGLIGGIGSMAGAVYGKAEEIANGVKDRIKGALRIQSPSKVFYGYGTNIIQGLINGISDNRKAAINSLNGIIPNTVPGGQAQVGTTAAVGAGAGIGQTINMTFNLEGIIARSRGDLREIGKDIISAVNEELRAKSIPEIGK